MFFWFIEHLTTIFWSLMAWIVLSIVFVIAYVLVRRWYIRRHPMPWDPMPWDLHIHNHSLPSTEDLRTWETPPEIQNNSPN